MYIMLVDPLFGTCCCSWVLLHPPPTTHPYLLIQLLKFSTETSNPVAPHCRNHGLPNKMSAGTRCFGFLWTQLRRNSRSSLENFLSLVLGGRLGAGSFKTVWGTEQTKTGNTTGQHAIQGNKYSGQQVFGATSIGGKTKKDLN